MQYPDEKFVADLAAVSNQLGTRARDVFNPLGVAQDELEQWLAGENLPGHTERKNIIFQAKKAL